jgi:hypothetical protein
MVYELLEAETAEDLQIKINQKLAAGWELYGDLVTAIKPDTSEVSGTIAFAVESKIILFQAVINKQNTKSDS